MDKNENKDLVEHYGLQWKDFDGTSRPKEETLKEFHSYFEIFPWEKLSCESEGFDAGCGNGRWAELFLQQKHVKKLNCIEPSNAIDVAKQKLKSKNVNFIKECINDHCLDDNSQDFGYCLGVLHYIPNPEDAMQCCVNKLKPGAPFLVYMYYNFENRPWWFKLIWKCSDLLRKIISRLPYHLRKVCTDVIAVVIYWPFAKVAKLLEKLNLPFENLPLCACRNESFYNMRTTSLDRFGSIIEHRFSKEDIITMMSKCGLENISFSNNPEVNWVAIGYKKSKTC